MGICASSGINKSSSSSKNMSGGGGGGGGLKKGAASSLVDIVDDKAFFTELAAKTTLQVKTRKGFRNDVPTTLLQVATRKGAGGGGNVATSSSSADGAESKQAEATAARPFLVETLQKIQGLSMDEERATLLASYMTPMDLGAGSSAEFIKAGDEVKGLYIVDAGTVAMPDGTTLARGGFFGVPSLLNFTVAEGAYTASAEAAGAAGAAASAGAKIWAIHRLMYQAVLIDMAKESGKKATGVVNKIPFFAPLSDQAKVTVARALQNGYRKYRSGAKIIEQNAAANSMFFIVSGEVAVFQKSRGEAEAKEVNRHGSGKFFGESCIKDAGGSAQQVRNADVVAASSVVECYELHRDDFLRTCGSLSELAQREGKARVLKSVPLLSALTLDEHVEIAGMLKVNVYTKGDVIIREGELGDEMFIIDNGEVEFTKDGASAGRFFQNQFFGEGSLVKPAPRRCTATAMTDTVCYSLACSEYRALFGESVKAEMARTLAVRRSADEPGGASEIRATDLNGIRMLGQGSYGKVTLVRHKTTGKTYALKQITREKVERLEQQKHVQSEKALLEDVNHPFVCNLVRTFRNSHSVYMLMEPVMGGELFTHLRKSGKFKPAKAQFYLAQVALVFEHLHSKSIIFRDLKPENLLINNDGFLKMVDFGLAKKCAGRTYTLCGTPAYASPEVYAVVGHDKGVDWWTFGVLMHECLAGYTPFVGSEANEIFAEIQRYQKHYPRVAFPSHFPKPAQAILKELLHPKSAQVRFLVASMCYCFYIFFYCVQSSKQLTPSCRRQPNPCIYKKHTHKKTQRLGNLKNGARDVKRHPYFAGYDWNALVNKEVEAPWIPPIDDAYDASNFRKQNQDFELSIEDNDGKAEKGWAGSF
jgi:cGMP-dependent protein kinase